MKLISIRFKLSILLFFLFVSAVSNTMFTFLLENYGNKKLAWVIHTYEVISNSEKLLASLTDAETGQRGFLLTKNTSYLEPFHSGIESSRRNLKKLITQTSDNKSQQIRLKELNQLMTKKFDELSLTIALTEKGQNDKALEIVKSNLGKQIMGDIRQVLNEFVNTEKLLLEQRYGDYRESRAKITTLILVEIMIFIFLSIATVVSIRSNLFEPLKLLLANTAKMEKGERHYVEDLLPRNEMGYLLSKFYEMSESVIDKSEKLAYIASHDNLTGGKNRLDLFDSLSNFLSNAHSDQWLVVLFIDLDEFKSLNDSLGHDAGDFVLQQTSYKLKDLLRSQDEIFRYGGDEFVVLIRDMYNLEQIHSKLDKILKAFDDPVRFNQCEIRIKLSIGVAIAPRDSHKVSEIMKYADIAMYESKKSNKNSYTIFDKKMLKRKKDI